MMTNLNSFLEIQRVIRLKSALKTRMHPEDLLSMEGQPAELSEEKLISSSGFYDSTQLMELSMEYFNGDGSMFKRIRLPFARTKDGMIRNLIVDLPERPVVMIRRLFGKLLYSKITEAEFLTLDFLLQKYWKDLDKDGLLDFIVLSIQAVNTKARDEYRKDLNSVSKLVNLELNRPYSLGYSCSPKIQNFLKRFGVEGQSISDLKSLLLKWKIPNQRRFGKPLVIGTISTKEPPRPKPKAFIAKGYSDQGHKPDPAKDTPFEIQNGEESSTSYDEKVSSILRSY